MTTELGTRTASGLIRGGGLWEPVWTPVRRFPRRLRERRFWHVQVMVLIATIPHYAIESSGEAFPTLESWQLNSLAISLYILPLLYAALNYSWEGAVLTALWAGMLTSPSLWFWHRSGTHWATEMGQLVVVLPVGVLAAWRVDKEAGLRRRAEMTSARLALLNEIGARLSQTLQVEDALSGVLERLQTDLGLRAAWLSLQSEFSSGSEPVVIERGLSCDQRPDDRLRLQRMSDLVISTKEPVRLNAQTVAVPLSAEGRVLGALGGVQNDNRALGDDDMELLTTVGLQVGATISNVRLYRERQESLQSYARQVTQAQEEERLRIARELHDETAQALVMLSRGLGGLTERSGEEFQEAVQDLRRLAQDTLQSLRRFSRDLRPSMLDDLGLVPAIEWLVSDAQERQDADTSFRATGEPHRLDPAIELALFRIAQEALRNVEKHSRATSASVELDFNEQEICLSVSDDGCGFEVPPAPQVLTYSGKLGLLGMKERAELVGGSFHITSQLGKGTTVAVTVEDTQAS